MDVYGIKPKTKTGEYFRNNIWFWHPLWDYCCYVDNSLVEKVPSAHSNQGDGLNASDSRQLGLKLLQTIQDGSAELYVKTYYEHLESLEKDPCHCTKNNVDLSKSTLELLIQSITGNKTIIQNFLPSVSLEQSYDPTGPIPFPKEPLANKSNSPKEDCNICHGSGFVDNFIKNYHINSENIESFAKFLLDCGGFQIC